MIAKSLNGFWRLRLVQLAGPGLMNGRAIGDACAPRREIVLKSSFKMLLSAALKLEKEGKNMKKDLKLSEDVEVSQRKAMRARW